MFSKSKLLVMTEKNQKGFFWDFYSKLIILVYCLLQMMHWPILPQFMDVYYHLLTAWGFIRAGGYSGWDFWQYAPAGRIHIYPPVFHLILALLIKLGINRIILAKLFELLMPVIFLIVLWYFIRKNYSERLAFFVMLTFSSSFPFYSSLLNHIPASLTLVFGFLALDQLVQNRILRPLAFLTLCFYTHISVSWLFALCIVLYGIFNRQYRKTGFLVFISAILLSLPILYKQFIGLKFVSFLEIPERNLCELKTVDYLLAFFGLGIIFKMPRQYRLFLSLFLASFIFLIYPYRFFSSQGYLPIIFLSAISLDFIYEKLQYKKLRLKYIFFLLIGYIVFFSPTMLMEIGNRKPDVRFKAYLFDSALTNTIFPDWHKRISSTSLWYPDSYLPAVEVIKCNSSQDDIIFSNIPVAGVILASISGRATANALFPEIGSSKKFDPISVSKIIVFPKDNYYQYRYLIDNYNLIKIGESKLFILYKNPFCQAKADIKKASVSFYTIALISSIFMILFLISKNYLTC